MNDSYTKDRRKLTERLIEARESVPLTQRQVAATGIISQSELSKLEGGKRKVDFLVLVRLAKLYKKDISFFKP